MLPLQLKGGPTVVPNVFRWAGRLAGVLVLASCGDGGSPPEPPRPAVVSIEVAVADSVLVPGQVSTAMAIARDASGGVITGRRVRWTSSDPTIVAVDPTGILTTLRSGPDVAIQGAVEGVSAQVVVSSRPGLIVGSIGATVSSADDRASITIPAGGVPERTAVRWEKESSPLSDFRLVANTAYRVMANAPLAKPAHVTIRYHVLEIPGEIPDALRLHELTSDMWVPYTATTVDTIARAVTALVRGFGTFALLGQGEAASIESAGDGSSEGAVGAHLAVQPQARVRNIMGHPLRGVTVYFVVTEGGGFVSDPMGFPGATARTDSSGVARVSGWVLGKAAGMNALSANTLGRPPITFRANGIAFRSIAVGENHVCGRDYFGEAWCWGENARAQLGTGQTTPFHSVAQRVTGSHSFAKLSAAGGNHTCGLEPDGELLCWGWAAYGAVGDGVYGFRSAPSPVAGPLKFRAMSAGEFHTCALTEEGQAYCWGSNYSGQLGDGTHLDHNIPAPVLTALRFTTIAVGAMQSCAVTSAGATYCWGDWVSEGPPFPPERLVPARVGGPSFTAIVAGRHHVCGLAVGGATWCWGANYAGQFGNGTTAGSGSPVPVPAAGSLTFVQLAAGAAHTCGLTVAGIAWCWGRNSSLEIGDGTHERRLSPVMVAGGLTFTSLAAGTGTCGITTTTAAYCWGLNAFGQVGDGTLVDRALPSPVRFLPP